MNDIKEKFNRKDTTRISVVYTFLISIGFMNYMIHTLFNVGGMIWSLAIVGAYMVFSYKTMVKVRFPAVAIALALVVSLYFVVTRQISVSSVIAREFAFYFVATSVLAMYKCDTEKVLRYISIVSIVILFFYKDIYIEMSSTTYKNSISMGLSYSLMPLLIAPIFHFFYYGKDRKQSVMYIVYAIAWFLLISLCLKGNRGIVVTVVTTLCFIYVKGIDIKQYGKVRAGRAFVIAGAIIFITIYFYEILYWVKSVLDTYGINAHFVNKIINLTKTGDISNGRISVLAYSIKEILEKPIFGHGIATMAYNSGINYAHNFIVQLLYDGGLVLTVPILLVFGRAIYYIFCGEDKDESIFTMFMFCITIPRVTFSGDIWQSPLFWLFIMHSIAYHTMKRKTGFSNTILYGHLNETVPIAEGEVVTNDK